MKNQRKPVIKRLSRAFNRFYNSQKFSGLILIFCTVVSLLVANSDFQVAYDQFWHRELEFSVSELHLHSSFSHFINDVLMAVFFLLVGMEIKRELLSGELSSFQRASLPVAAAMGGMIVPALIYAFFNIGLPTSSGWGIPMATDIAFALGILSLGGKRVPDALKILLAALAVVDDLGAVVVIAIFYTSSIQLHFLLFAAGIVVLLLMMNRFGVNWLPAYLLPGIALWYFVYMSGIHATIAGVLLAVTIPYRNGRNRNPLQHLEHLLYTPVNKFIMPLFALANTAIVLEPEVFSQLTGNQSIGIFLGLLLGKPIGIVLFIWLAVKLKLSSLPAFIRFRHLTGLGFLGGIGFTMAIFISMLAFEDPLLIAVSKVSILLASLVAGLTGYFILRSSPYESSGAR